MALVKRGEETRSSRGPNGIAEATYSGLEWPQKRNGAAPACASKPVSLLIDQARFCKAEQGGMVATDRGEFASDTDVQRVFQKWGVDVDA